MKEYTIKIIPYHFFNQKASDSSKIKAKKLFTYKIEAEDLDAAIEIATWLYNSIKDAYDNCEWIRIFEDSKEVYYAREDQILDSIAGIKIEGV